MEIRLARSVSPVFYLNNGLQKDQDEVSGPEITNLKIGICVATFLRTLHCFCWAAW